MPLLGAHMSVAGGFHNAVDAAAEHGMECVQIFTKNNNQWQARPPRASTFTCLQPSTGQKVFLIDCDSESFSLE